VTDQDEEVAKAIRKRFERKFHRSPANINPAEAFKLLNSSEATRLLTWEGQVAACAEDENDEFWMKVTEKTQRLGLKKTDAILEVYIDRFVGTCEGDVNTALLWIIEQDLSEFSMSLFVTRLLERGADPTATDTNLNSALHLAARRGITTVAKQLVEFGAVLEAKNTNSETPLELAIEGRHNNVATFLVKSMRPIRVRELFECNQMEASARLSFHDLIRQKATLKKMESTVLAILDCMMEKLEGEDNKYVVYYKILDADHNGRSPKDRNFDKSHKSCLQKIAKSGNKDVVYHDVVRLLLRKKWKKFARFHFLIQCLVFLVFYAILNAALLLAAQSPDPRVYNQPADYIRGIFEAVTFLNVMWNLFSELNQLRKHRLAYFLDPYNYLDIAAIASPLLIIPFRIANLNVQWLFSAFAFLFVGMRMFKYLSAIRATGAYVKILFRIIVIDIVQFGIIFLVIWYAFSGAIYLALRGEELSPAAQEELMVQNTTIPGFPSSLDISPLETSQLYYVWLWGIRVMIEAGDVLAQPYYGVAGFNGLGVLLYLTFLFIVVVILLNLLIASMTDTYTNVQRDAQRDLVLDRAWIVARVEHNSMLSLDYRKLTYISAEVVENPHDILERWEVPPINIVSRQLDKLERRIKEQEDSIDRVKVDIMDHLRQQERLMEQLLTKVESLTNALPQDP
jgi:ankyrin repeat protein